MSSRSRLARFLALSRAERAILLQALVMIPALAIGLRLLGLRRMRPRGQPGNAAAATLDPRVAARLVGVATRCMPWRVGCLGASLALQRLLHRRGIASDLRLGVRKAGDSIEAHAWIEHGGAVLFDLREPHLTFAPFGGGPESARP